MDQFYPAALPYVLERTAGRQGSNIVSIKAATLVLANRTVLIVHIASWTPLSFCCSQTRQLLARLTYKTCLIVTGQRPIWVAP